MKMVNRIACLLLVAGSASLCLVRQADAANVSTCADVQAMNGSNTYVLTGDIDCTDFVFTPINDFSGILDGAGYTISNLTSQNLTNGEALFNNTEGAVIRDLTLDDVNIIGNYIVGGIVGTAVDTKLINVNVSGVMQSTALLSLLGGIAGQTDETTVIANASSSITATGYSIMGGIAGINRGIIRRSSALTGSLTGDDDGEGATNIGGLVGENTGASALIEDSYSLFNVSGSGSGLGGLVGNNVNDATISRSLSYGDVMGAEAGGLVGTESGDASTLYSFWNKELSELTTSASGTGLLNAAMMTSATFTAVGYDFDNIWSITEGVTFPSINFFGPPSSYTEPSIDTFSPANGDVRISRSTDSLILSFDEPMLVGTGYVDLYTDSDTRSEHIDVTGSAVTGDGTTTITVALPSRLRAGEQYVRIDSTAFDSFSGISYAGIGDTTTWRFSARSSSDPTLTAGRDYSISDVEVQVRDGVVDIAWTSGTNVNFVTVWATDVQGVTWPIATNLANTGSVTWTYPADATDSAITVTVSSTDLATLLASSTSLSIPLLETSSSESSQHADTDVTDDEDELTGPSPVDGTMETITRVIPGMYIKAPSFSTVYYVTDDYHRRPFFNETTYFTYTDTMDDIVTVTDATLPTLPLGVPMPPKAAVVLLKIPNEETVYEIDANHRLHIIADEAAAVSQYGAHWSDYVIDLDPVCFGQLIRDAVPLSTPSEHSDRAIMKTREALVLLAH